MTRPHNSRKPPVLKIGIIGLGYVGLPLAVEFGKARCPVTGFEIDRHKIALLNKGISYVNDLQSEDLQQMIHSKMFSAVTNAQLLRDMDIVIICVPTPLRKTKDPDISFIIEAIKSIIRYRKKNQLIILESTTYPGTTKEVVLPMLSTPGWKVGKDFFLAFSPERVDPGNKRFGIANTPKIVGGITPSCTKRACAVYERIVQNVVPVSSTETAEMVKLLENTFRAVNIGLVNEVALMCDTLGLDVWEVINAAASKPFGFMPFYPGPGIGGHCIPLDPHYLSWKLKTLNFYARFIELAADVNSKMPGFLVRKIGDALNESKKSIKGSRILLLGISYKKDTGDVRESPALDVMELLQKKQATLQYHDPYVPRAEVNTKKYKSIPLRLSSIRSADCVVITTNHSTFNIPQIVHHARLIIDARNATEGIRSKKIVKL